MLSQNASFLSRLMFLPLTPGPSPPIKSGERGAKAMGRGARRLQADDRVAGPHAVRGQRELIVAPISPFRIP